MSKDSRIYGRNPVREALEGELEIEKIFLQQDMTGEFEVFIRHSCQEKNISLSKVPLPKLDRLAKNSNHQGVVAITSPIKYYQLEDIFTYDVENLQICLILDGITDVRNVGAIARTALAFGVTGIILTTKGSVSINEDAVKTSSGAILKIPICREKNVMIAIEKMQQIGFQVLATDLQAKDFIDDHLIEGPIALVMGSEDKGVSREALRIADGTTKIRQSNAIDSLNVSVATGIALSELYKKIKL